MPPVDLMKSDSVIQSERLSSRFQPMRDTNNHSAEVAIITPRGVHTTTAKPSCGSKMTRDKKQIEEFMFLYFLYLSGALCVLQTHKVQPAWPVSTRPPKLPKADETGRRLVPKLFISPPALHFQKASRSWPVCPESTQERAE